MKPLISIITPAYNSERFIEKTILSVITQEYDHFEYIIIDGNSTDRTLDICNKYRQNINHLISEPDKGMYDAINKGMRLAKGDILAYINSDDILLPGTLGYIARKFEEEKFDLCFGYTNFIGPDDELKYSHKAINFKTNNVLALGRLPFCQQSCFFSSKLYFSLNGFDENLKYVGDTKFFLSAYMVNNLKTSIVKKNLAAFRLHEDCLSIAQRSTMESERELMINQLGINLERNQYFLFLKRIILEITIKLFNIKGIIKKQLSV